MKAPLAAVLMVKEEKNMVLAYSVVPMTAYAQDTSNITMAVSATSVAVGETFTVTLSTKAMSVISFTGGITFDDSKVEVTSIEGTRAGDTGVEYIRKTNGDYVELAASTTDESHGHSRERLH